MSSHRSLNNRTASFTEADRIRALQALGGLSSINPETMTMPLSTNYLHNSHHHPQLPSNNTQSMPPPLPPRGETSRQMDRFGRFPGYNNNFFTPSPYSRFSPPGMYTPAYGGFRAPYNRFGIPDSNSSFIQLAEESTRPAFESIESVVDIVGSISMMLESTYHAVHSSYSAILGVVEQFSRLKDHLTEVLSFLALLRGLKYLCLKILYLLRLRKDNPSVEAAWNNAQSAAGQDLLIPDDGKSPWPFFMFLGLVLGAPWLMFKLLARSVANKKPFDISTWQIQDGRLMACCAAYDFNTNRHGELSFKAGDTLYVAPKQFQKAPRGWMLACHKQRKVVGLIPQNYMKTQAMGSPKPAKPRAAVERVPGDFVEPFAFPTVGSTSKEPIGSNITNPCNPSTSNEDINPSKTVIAKETVQSKLRDLIKSSIEENNSSVNIIPEDPVEANLTDLCSSATSSDGIKSSENLSDPFAVKPDTDVENERN